MPIEIRELVIRATISSSTDRNTTSQNNRIREKESLVKECVDQVLQILKDQKEK